MRAIASGSRCDCSSESQKGRAACAIEAGASLRRHHDTGAEPAHTKARSPGASSAGSQAVTTPSGAVAIAAPGAREIATTSAVVSPGPDGQLTALDRREAAHAHERRGVPGEIASASHAASEATGKPPISATSRAPEQAADARGRRRQHDDPRRARPPYRRGLRRRRAPRHARFAFAIRRAPPVARSDSSPGPSAIASMQSPAVESTAPKGRFASTLARTRKPVRPSEALSGAAASHPAPPARRGRRGRRATRRASRRRTRRRSPTRRRGRWTTTVSRAGRRLPRASVWSKATPPPSAPCAVTCPPSHAHQPAEALAVHGHRPLPCLDVAGSRDGDEAGCGGRVRLDGAPRRELVRGHLRHAVCDERGLGVGERRAKDAGARHDPPADDRGHGQGDEVGSDDDGAPHATPGSGGQLLLELVSSRLGCRQRLAPRAFVLRVPALQDRQCTLDLVEVLGRGRRPIGHSLVNGRVGPAGKSPAMPDTIDARCAPGSRRTPCSCWGSWGAACASGSGVGDRGGGPAGPGQRATAAAGAGRVRSNVSRGDYAGSAACAVPRRHRRRVGAIPHAPHDPRRARGAEIALRSTGRAGHSRTTP